MSTGSTVAWPSTMSTRATVQSSWVYGSCAENGFSLLASWAKMPPPNMPSKPLLVLPGPCVSRTCPLALDAIWRAETPLAWRFAVNARRRYEARVNPVAGHKTGAHVLDGRD